MDKGTRWISLLAVSLAAACGGGSVLFGAMGAFTNSGDYPTDSESFSDAQVDGLLETLDSLLATRETPRDFARGTSARIRAFGRMLQRGHLSPDQTSRVVAHLEQVGAADPGAAEVIDKHRYLVENLIPGRIAPDPSTWGPIASAWDVVTWPATFILDEKGVIRYVGKRGDAMIAAVDRLLAEKENPR